MKKTMVYDIFDGVNSYQRAINLLKKCMEQIEAFEGDNVETLGYLRVLVLMMMRLKLWGLGI